MKYVYVQNVMSDQLVLIIGLHSTTEGVRFKEICCWPAQQLFRTRGCNIGMKANVERRQGGRLRQQIAAMAAKYASA